MTKVIVLNEGRVDLD